MVASFGRSSEGIDFCSIDNNPVHFAVLFLVPREQYNLHLKTLAAIAKILNSGEIRNQLSDATSEERILDVLSQRSARV